MLAYCLTLLVTLNIQASLAVFQETIRQNYFPELD